MAFCSVEIWVMRQIIGWIVASSHHFPFCITSHKDNVCLCEIKYKKNKAFAYLLPCRINDSMSTIFHHHANCCTQIFLRIQNSLSQLKKNAIVPPTEFFARKVRQPKNNKCLSYAVHFTIENHKMSKIKLQTHLKCQTHPLYAH